MGRTLLSDKACGSVSPAREHAGADDRMILELLSCFVVSVFWVAQLFSAAIKNVQNKQCAPTVEERRDKESARLWKSGASTPHKASPP